LLRGLDRHLPELSRLSIRFQLIAAHDLSPMKSQADYQLFKERYKMLLLGTLHSAYVKVTVSGDHSVENRW
jgi:hypothetical protein